jgi:flagellar biosynthetic protein FlhB
MSIFEYSNTLKYILESDINLSDSVFDLQLFAAEDEGRTEEGSDRRRKEERDKGNVPKSIELPQALVLITGVLAIYLLGDFFFKNSFILFKKYFNGIRFRTEFTTEEFSVLLKSAATDISLLLFPILGVTFVAAVIGNIVQVGLLFAPAAVSFNFSKIIPRFGKVLPTKNTIYNLIKSLGKVIIIGWVSYVIISMDFLSVLLTGEMGLKSALKVLAISSVKIFLVVGLILFSLSIYDYFYQKEQFEDSIKMTPSEAKQEMKESEGDKTLLNRRRQMVRDFIRRGMLQRVPKADLVIVNPTHYSIALVYDPNKHLAPIVTAKGVDELALVMRRIAKKNNVPIVEDRVQARLLYDEVEVDEEIPAKFFRAISIIISKLDKYRRVAS